MQITKSASDQEFENTTDEIFEDSILRSFWFRYCYTGKWYIFDSRAI